LKPLLRRDPSVRKKAVFGGRAHEGLPEGVLEPGDLVPSAEVPLNVDPRNDLEGRRFFLLPLGCQGDRGRAEYQKQDQYASLHLFLLDEPWGSIVCSGPMRALVF
jgi:hypothetical protein